MSAIFEACLPTLFVRDMDEAARFYTAVMGREIKRFGDNIQLAGPGVTLALRPRRVKPRSSPQVNLGFIVRDIAGGDGSAFAKGITFIGDIVETPRAKVAFFCDPDGTSLYVSVAGLVRPAGFEPAAERYRTPLRRSRMCCALIVVEPAVIVGSV
jgi:catechol 2,3-dioxygenase-like lactoylglutathione lyase family enzyme